MADNNTLDFKKENGIHTPLLLYYEMQEMLLKLMNYETLGCTRMITRGQ